MLPFDLGKSKGSFRGYWIIVQSEVSTLYMTSQELNQPIKLKCVNTVGPFFNNLCYNNSYNSRQKNLAYFNLHVVLKNMQF